ncbi:UNVERIFIED_CONTAM: lactoylglutathione lyase [Paenibacillus sp. PvR008]
MAIQKVDHVGIMVKNIEESIQFYKLVFGLEVLKRMPNGNAKLAFLGFPNTLKTELELMEIPGHSTREINIVGRVHHIAFTVDDIKNEISRLQEFGIPLSNSDITTLPNGSKFIFFVGPDGEYLELFQAPTVIN